MRSPCINCPDRHAECHPSCEPYKEWKEWKNKAVDARTKHNLATPEMSRRSKRALWKGMMKK